MLELSRTEIFNLVNAKRQKEQEILPASRTKPLRNGSPSNIHGHGHYQQSRHSHHHPGCDLQWKSERPNERPPTRTPLQPLYYIKVTSPSKPKEDMLRFCCCHGQTHLTIVGSRQNITSPAKSGSSILIEIDHTHIVLDSCPQSSRAKQNVPAH